MLPPSLLLGAAIQELPPQSFDVRLGLPQVMLVLFEQTLGAATEPAVTSDLEPL